MTQKPSDCKAQVLELWGNVEYLFIATAPRVVVPDKIVSMGQIKLFDHVTVCKQMTYWIDSDT